MSKSTARAPRPSAEPVCDIILNLRSGDGGSHFLRVASSRGEATAEDILRRLRPYLRLDVELSYAIEPTRFVGVKPKPGAEPTITAPRVPKDATIYVRMPRALHTMIKRRAKEAGCSVNEWGNRAIEEGMAARKERTKR